MQFNQPCFPMPNMFPINHYVPTGNIGTHAPLPRQGLMGEGNVTPVVGSDGNITFFFTPLTQYNANPYFSNCMPNQPLNPWLVRNICNPLSPPVFVQQLQNPFGWGNLWRPEENILPLFGNGLKFHNDSSSSTTDLHYFCPALQDKRKLAAAIQVRFITPTQDQNVGTSRLKFCKCGSRRDSDMSVDDTAAKGKRKHRRKRTDLAKNKATGCSPIDSYNNDTHDIYHTFEELVANLRQPCCDRSTRDNRNTGWFENVLKKKICKDMITSSSESSISSLYECCMPY